MHRERQAVIRKFFGRGVQVVVFVTGVQRIADGGVGIATVLFILFYAVQVKWLDQ